MSRICILTVAACLIGSMPLVSRAAETAAKPSSEQKAAAMDLLQAMHMDKVLGDAIGTMLDIQVKQNPAIAQFKPIMQDFFKKYMSWDALKDDMAALYAEEFSASELKELTAFYKTPTGMKLASKQSILMTKGSQLGQKRVQEHIGELREAIQAQAAKSAPKPAGNSGSGNGNGL